MATLTKRHAQGNGLTALRVLDKYVLGTSQFMEIPLTDLHVDGKYQREPNETGIHRIVANFDINLFEPPTVNDRSGWQGYKGQRWALIDGQHRSEAARRIGMSTITCRVVAVESAMEAELFVQLNRQRLWLNPLQAYKAELEAGNPAVREIQMCLSERNLKIGAKAEGTVSAVVALKRIYSSGGYVGLARVLDTASLSWPADDSERFSGKSLLGIYAFLTSNPRADLNRLAERLASVTPRHLQARASQRWHAWKGLGNKASIVDALADEIGRIYRKR